jgi:ribosomal protein S18 acetylase RimI-like enzyme
MTVSERVVATRVTDEAGRNAVIAVLRATYQREKKWVSDPQSQIPLSDLAREDIAWFLATWRGRPAGVVRVLYNPPLELYAQYGFRQIDTSIRIEDFVRDNRIAEIGRFAVVPRYRRRVMLAAELMRAATADVVEHGYTHFVTDVFEDDPHSPLGFHTRVMGFHPVATHDVGELQCRSRRVTLVLDLRACYRRLKSRGNWMFRYLTASWDARLHRQMAM